LEPIIAVYTYFSSPPLLLRQLHPLGDYDVANYGT